MRKPKARLDAHGKDGTGPNLVPGLMEFTLLGKTIFGGK